MISGFTREKCLPNFQYKKEKFIAGAYCFPRWFCKKKPKKKNKIDRFSKDRFSQRLAMGKVWIKLLLKDQWEADVELINQQQTT